MSVPSIRKAWEKAVKAMTPALPTIWDNDPAGDPPAGAYQRVSLLMAAPLNDEMGSAHQKRGVCQITLCYPAGENSRAVDLRADKIEQAFPRGCPLTADGLTLTVQNTAEILPGYRDADRWCVPVRLTFWSNQIAAA